MAGSQTAAMGLVLLAVATAGVPAHASVANRHSQTAVAMASGAKNVKTVGVDEDAHHMCDVFFQAAAKESPIISELALPAKIGKENAGIVLRALARASGYGYSKDGKTLWKLARPDEKLTWLKPGHGSRLPAPAKKQSRGKGAANLDPSRCVPGPPATVSRAAPLTEADDESMADGAMADVAADTR